MADIIPTDNLYPKMFVLELIEKTKRCAIRWDKTSLSTYETSWYVGNKMYVASLVHMQLNYQISITLNTRPIYTLNSLFVPEIIDLFNVLGMLLGQSVKVIEAIQDQDPCTQIGGVVTFDSGSGTWVVPLRIRNAQVEIWGGGGAGGIVSVGLVKALSGPAVRSFTLPYTLPGNDDDSTIPINIGFSINLFGTTFDEVYVNNNGNISFLQAITHFAPVPIVFNETPMIAPFWSDVDTRLGSAVTYGPDTVDGHNAFVVNWVGVRHYDTANVVDHGLPENSFQLVLIEREDLNAGDFDFEFNYDTVVWESGQASGSDSAGLGGISARVGYSDGSENSYELAGSAVNGALLDDGPADTSLIQNSLNSSVAGRYIFNVRNSDVVFLGAGGVITGGSAEIEYLGLHNSTGGVVTGGTAEVVSAFIGSTTGGGGAGGYTTYTFPVVAGQEFYYTVGSGATLEEEATDTQVEFGATTLIAYHGLSADSEVGAIGGEFLGGSGRVGGSGEDGEERLGGIGGRAYLGGVGGTAGLAGHAPGGGGGGAVTNVDPGIGANGRVRITYSG